MPDMTHKSSPPEWSQVKVLVNSGHTLHCACQMVCGDGVCTCNQQGDNKTPEKLDKFIERMKRIENDP